MFFSAGDMFDLDVCLVASAKGKENTHFACALEGLHKSLLQLYIQGKSVVHPRIKKS